MNIVHHRFFSRYAVLAVAIAVYTLSLAGCGGSSGGSGGGGSSQPPSSALVVGTASGPIYDELAASYHVRRGKGTESSAGFDVLIYDAKSVTPEEIEGLPATVNFLLGGKIVIVLNPTQADRAALEDLTGATAG
jgi:hypothetical protein